MAFRVVLTLLVALGAAGCGTPAPQACPPIALTASTHPSQPMLLPAAWIPELHALCALPVGWTLDSTPKQPGSESEFWVSPTGATAFGVIAVRNFLMPLASDDLILSKFLDGMRKSEGAGDLLEKRVNRELQRGIGGLSFVAAGGRYTVHGNLVSSGSFAWIIYAGTRRDRNVNAIELEIAAQARDAAIVQPALILKQP